MSDFLLQDSEAPARDTGRRIAPKIKLLSRWYTATLIFPAGTHAAILQSWAAMEQLAKVATRSPPEQEVQTLSGYN